MCDAYSKQYGFNAFTVMPCNVYGVGDNFHPEHSHVIAGMMRRFYEAKVSGAEHVTVWGTGSPLRELIDADDLADACVFLLRGYDGGGMVNTGSGQEISIRDLALLMKSIVEFDGDVQFDASRPDGTPRKLMDNSKLSAAAVAWPALGRRSGPGQDVQLVRRVRSGIHRTGSSPRGRAGRRPKDTNAMIQILFWLLPASRLKNRLLRMFGHDIHPSAHIGPNLVVGVVKFEIGQTAAIGPFNVFRGLGLMSLSEYSIVNSWNWISAHPVYRNVDSNAGTLFLGTCARIGSRNYLDASRDNRDQSVLVCRRQQMPTPNSRATFRDRSTVSWAHHSRSPFDGRQSSGSTQGSGTARRVFAGG